MPGTPEYLAISGATNDRHPLEMTLRR